MHAKVVDRQSSAYSNRFGYFAVAAIITFCTIGGFINLLSPPNIYLSTVAIDLLYVAIFGSMGVALLRTRGAKFEPWVLWLIGLIIMYLTLSVQGPEPLVLRLRVTRNVAIYAAIAVYVTIMIRRKEDQNRLIHLALNLATIVALFGIVQSMMGTSLPLNLQSTREFGAFGYVGTDILRSNGLVGNTIVYGHFMCLTFAISLPKLLARFSWLDVIRTGIIGTALIASYSRSAITGAVIIVLAVSVVLYARRGPRALLVLTGVGAGLLATITTTILANRHLYDTVVNSFLVKDLFLSQNASVINSNEGHRTVIEVAIASFNQSPWTGLGIGSQSIDSNLAASGTFVAVDGFAWAILVEGGLLLALVYCAFIISALMATFRELGKDREREYLILGFLVFSLFQFGLSVFINTGYAGKTPFIMYWVYFGLIMAGKRSRLDQEPTLDIDRHKSISAVLRN